MEELQAGAGQIPDGPHAVPGQLAGGGRADVEQVGDGQGPDHVPVIAFGDDRGGVRFFVVAAQLGEHLVEGHPDGGGELQLPPDTGADLVGDGRAGAEQAHAAADVQPALVQPEGLHPVGVAHVDLPDRR